MQRIAFPFELVLFVNNRKNRPYQLAFSLEILHFHSPSDILYFRKLRKKKGREAMLSAWPWMRPTQLLLTELMQQRDEGKELGDTEALCKKLAAHSGELEAEQLAQALLTFWNSLPVKEGYPYQEPSTLLEIQALRPKDRSQDRPSLSSEKQLRDRLTGAFSGRIAGCLLGKTSGRMDAKGSAGFRKAQRQLPSFPLLPSL